MSERMSERVTAAQLIAELQKLPPDAEVVTSIYGWEGTDVGPVSIVEPLKVVDNGRHVRPVREGQKVERTVYLLDTPS